MHSQKVSELDLEIIGEFLNRFANRLVFIFFQTIKDDLLKIFLIKRQTYFDHACEHFKRLICEGILNTLVLVVRL